ncbi:hypothetical protein JANAI62_20990 [Jannaschia pagri]|uniref:Uncharacterized protein n=1 Tax=Jannaschia pagri TaxID=2829797 RepID=A0ABQ4NM88_9RHOB|nr:MULTISPECIES: hypothetical protein [unclassified Jannaschia]GIT91642.1 hypothetical protein JANAI61_21000 [Jannaschia sp. AI_61]GIT95476.1 hypothetical protein JANAI62_20990 [Jannaschia sp. AI_62]
MLRFRRSTATKPEETPSPDASRPDTPKDRAQALLALLGEDGSIDTQGGAAPMPPERLRELARDLIAQVEARSGGSEPSGDEVRAAPPGAAPNPEPQEEDGTSPAHPLGTHRVFRSDAPLAFSEVLEQTAPPPDPQPVETPTQPAVEPTDDHVSLPEVLSPTPQPQADQLAPSSPLLSQDDVMRLVDGGIDRQAVSQEHSHIIALSLRNLPPLDQAAALRALPRGMVRAVHRAMRLIEAMADAGPGAVSSHDEDASPAPNL